MPTLSQIQLPKPQGYAEFESIVASAVATRGVTQQPRKIGRNGQAQQGVDIHYVDTLGRQTGVQCKLVTEFSIEDLNAAVGEAEEFKPTLENFYVAVAMPRDAKLQKVHAFFQRNARSTHSRRWEGKLPRQVDG